MQTNDALAALSRNVIQFAEQLNAYQEILKTQVAHDPQHREKGGLKPIPGTEKIHFDIRKVRNELGILLSHIEDALQSHSQA